MRDSAVSALQSLVLRLTRFWIDEGCYFLPGYDAPVVAALQHPRAFLTLFDNDPRCLAFLQTVRRPGDGRHGEQPYRLGHHLQLEVLLSPAPGDFMACYLRSLRAIGMQLDLHDLRFAESRWDLPALGAWGQGWSVRVDGMGVTRLTLLQAAGGTPLTPVRLEIVYGIERLATCLAGAASAYDVAWADDGPSHGALYRLDEAERSRYDMGVADPEALERCWYDALAAADTALAAGLAGVAYESAMAALFALERQAARGVLPAGGYQAGASEVAVRVAAVAASLPGQGRAEAVQQEGEARGTAR